MNRRISIVLAGIVLAATGWRAAVAPLAAAVPQRAPQILTESLAGRDTFALYCSPCHGATGHGDGPVAAALRARPTDLTMLAQQNGGMFPRARVRDYIVGTGRQIAAHGTTEMPIWGPMFRAFESDARVRERIENLVEYLESIQPPSSSRPPQRGA